MNCSEIFSVGPNFTLVKLDVANYTDSSYVLFILQSPEYK